MKNLHKNVGIFSLSMVAAATAVYIYSPVIGSHADTSATADINLNVGEVLNLTLDTNSLDLSTTINSFVSETINATASTNSQYGYTLTLEDVDSNTNLVHTNENIDATVASNFSGSKTSSEMEDNTWGFSLNTTDFYKVPANGSPVALKRTNVPMATESETTPVTFGAKLGNLTSGTYTDKILFTLYTNGQNGRPNVDPPVYPSRPGEDPTPTMQGFSCDTALPNTHDAVVLMDSRDGNEYTIKKLADGNCWMTENLRLIDKTISGADSNLPAGEVFTIPKSKITGFESYNIALAYLDETYGGYYNFYTATGGWGTGSLNEGTAPQDICPKGWRLPTGGEGGEFETLYGYYNSLELLQGEPNFVFSGFIKSDGKISEAEFAGYFRSSVIQSYWRAHNLIINNNGSIGATSFTYKTGGEAIRCLAKK